MPFVFSLADVGQAITQVLLAIFVSALLAILLVWLEWHLLVYLVWPWLFGTRFAFVVGLVLSIGAFLLFFVVSVVLICRGKFLF